MIDTKIFHITKSICRGAFFRTPRYKNKFAALLYHRISDKNREDELIPDLINASAEEFENEIKFMVKNFNMISMDDALNFLEHARPLPENSLLLTFDDGYMDNYTNAFPVLKRYSVPAVVFLTTKSVGDNPKFIWTDKIAYAIRMTNRQDLNMEGVGRLRFGKRGGKQKAALKIIEYLKKVRDSEKDKLIEALIEKLEMGSDAGSPEGLYLSNSQIMEMSRWGVAFGSHGCSHSILTRLGQGSLSAEIFESKTAVGKIIGRDTDLFAYPNGGRLDFNEDITRILKKAGYRAAFTTMSGLNKMDKGLMFLLRRISAGRSLAEFKDNLCQAPKC